MNALCSERETGFAERKRRWGSGGRHSREFKQQAVEWMKGCDNIHEPARELGIERKLLYSWRYQFERGAQAR